MSDVTGATVDDGIVGKRSRGESPSDGGRDRGQICKGGSSGTSGRGGRGSKGYGF